MYPVKHLSLPEAFDPNAECFSKDVDEKGDEAFRVCKDRITAVETVVQQRSRRATNLIVCTVDDLVARPLREQMNFPNSAASEIDSISAEKARKIIHHLFSSYFQDSLPMESDKQQTEWTKRASNILRSYYRSELSYLGRFLEMPKILATVGLPKILSTRDQVHDSRIQRYFYSMRHGTLAEIIGREAQRQFEKMFPSK